MTGHSRAAPPDKEQRAQDTLPQDITLHGWLESERLGEQRPQNTTDAVVVHTADGPPRIHRQFRIGLLDVAVVSAGRVDVEPMPTARRWRGVVLGYVLDGELQVTQGDQSVRVGRGDFVFYTAAQRYRISAADDHEFLVVRIPTSSIALRHTAFSDIVATDLSALPSAGVLRGILRGLAEAGIGDTAAGGEPSFAAGAHLGDALVAAAHAVIADARPPGSATSMSLFHTLVLWIEENLADPDLSAEQVAAAQFLSPRYVRRLFADNGVTVAALIRQRRLERVRDDLLDARRAREPIRAIADRWGFSDAAGFSRAFSRHFGASPRHYRASHLHQGIPASVALTPMHDDPDLPRVERDVPAQEKP